MATEVGSCPACGTPRIAAGQVTCAGCGGTFAGAEPGHVPGGAAGGLPGSTPADEAGGGSSWIARHGMIATMTVGVALLLVLAIIGIVVLRGGSHDSAGITYTPSTISCGEAYKVVVRIPGSTAASEMITFDWDGLIHTRSARVDQVLFKMSDNSWAGQSDYAQGSWFCPLQGSMSVGPHVERVLDSSGAVLAQGSYTVTG